jgi:DNA-directed RNA polymerase specialized sigma24 family protein
MTPEETRNYLKSYRNMRNRVEYINNKMINVKSIRYDDSPSGSYSEPKTQNDYIMMKDKYIAQMSLIREDIEKLDNMNHRDALFYKYVELMSDYDIADLMQYSVGTVRHFLYSGIIELSEVINDKNVTKSIEKS